MLNPWKRLKAKAYERLDRVFEDAELLTAEECYQHPFVFLYISRRFVKKHTEDWYRPYEGTPVISRFIAFSLCSSLFWGTFLTVLFSAFAGAWIGEGWFFWTFFVVGAVAGGMRFYRPLIREELGPLNRKLDRIQATLKLERWQRNGALKGFFESLGTEYFLHEYSHEN